MESFSLFVLVHAVQGPATHISQKKSTGIRKASLAEVKQPLFAKVENLCRVWLNNLIVSDGRAMHASEWHD